MAPRRIEDATAVAERIRRAFDELAPMLEVRVGLAAYPPFPGDAMAFFRLAARNARQEGRAASRGINFCAWSTNDASAPINEEQVHVNAEDFGDVRQPVGR